jgi:hypothetical protein
LHIDNVDGLEDVLKGCCQRIGLGFVEPRANDQRRFRCNQRDLKRLRRNGLDVAQAGRGKCGVCRRSRFL